MPPTAVFNKQHQNENEKNYNFNQDKLLAIKPSYRNVYHC